jgi:hypothetical protein
MALTMPVAIVLSVGMLVVGSFVYGAVEHQRDVDDIALLQSAVPNVVVRAQPASDPRLTAEVLAAARQKHLRAGQRCVGGVVVTVEGSSYTQSGERCSGDLILR